MWRIDLIVAAKRAAKAATIRNPHAEGTGLSLPSICSRRADRDEHRTPVLTDVSVLFAGGAKTPKPKHPKSSRPTTTVSTMAANRPITGRAMANDCPLAVTVPRACELSGFGPTSIWAFLKDGRLEAVRVRGVRRTLVAYGSLARLLAPASGVPPEPRRRGRPRKNSDRVAR